MSRTWSLILVRGVERDRGALQDGVAGADVHRDTDVVTAVEPRAALGERRLQHVVRERADHARLLRERDELVGPHQPVAWMHG